MFRGWKLLTIAGAALTLLIVAGCGSQQEPQTTTQENTQKTMANTADQTAAYPIDWCVVSGEKLGEMGKPYDYDYQGRKIKFCCGMCVKTFEADPARYIARLDSAVAGQIHQPMEHDEGGEHEGHDHGI